MMIKRALLAAIALTAIIFAVVNLTQNLTAALLSLAVGSIWLYQEFTERETLNSLYFLVFFGLTVLDALANQSLLGLLLGMSAALVAWDLSRFRRRIREEEADDEKARLERAHLQKLAIPVGAGFVIALLPALLTISVSFVVLFALMLIALLVLRQSMLSLRNIDRNKL
jgi:hypothetical protein